jgi:hypothetical protein
MRKTFKTVHMLGLALFLGSIAVYVALSTQHWVPGTPAFAQLRAQILLATRYVTVPGLLATLASGVGLLWVNRRQLKRWQIAKAVVGVLLLVNTWVLVGPAIEAAAALSATASSSAQALGGLLSAVKLETAAGALNLLLAAIEILLAVCRPELRRRSAVRPERPISAPPAPASSAVR